MLHNIEDILEYVKNHDLASTVDKGILYSIARQVSRGIALTDLQFDLAKVKLQAYKDNLLSNNFEVAAEFDAALNMLRRPLRTVDRSKTVTVTENDMIAVRFPFNKKTIVLIEEVASKLRRFYKHEKGTHVHYFKLNELTVDAIVGKFREKTFYIEPELLEQYEKIQKVRANTDTVVPGVYYNELKNFRPAALEFMHQELGPLTNENRLMYFDRRERYGIAHFDYAKPEGLLGELLYRENGQVAISPSKYTVEELVDTLVQLRRLPLLVLVDEEHALKQVSMIYNTAKTVASAEQTCLFRVENESKSEYNLNKFIKDSGLNNWLDKDTKIVYISKNKLPKLLLKTDWRPMAVIGLSSLRANNSVQTYALDITDLVVFYDEDLSLIKKTRTNGYY